MAQRMEVGVGADEVAVGFVPGGAEGDGSAGGEGLDAERSQLVSAGVMLERVAAARGRARKRESGELAHRGSSVGGVCCGTGRMLHRSGNLLFRFSCGEKRFFFGTT